MAEYKNGFNAFGGIPVSPDKLSPDVRSGRAVYADDTAYASDDEYKRNVNSKVREGFHRETPIVVPQQDDTTPDSGGGGSSSDFSTATVTIDIGEGIIAFDFETGVDYIINDEYDGEQYAYSAKLAIGDTLSQTPTELPSINTIPLLLYRGQCYLSLPINGVTTSKSYVRGTGVSVTGNATLDQENSRVIITGDCTITVDNWVM